jgi:hypothetical protein
LLTAEEIHQPFDNVKAKGEFSLENGSDNEPKEKHFCLISSTDVRLPSQQGNGKL